MSNEFQLPARPWGDAEIKSLKANAHLLDDETRAELGLGPAPVADSTPSEEPTVVEEPTVEETETEVETPQEEVTTEETTEEETVENLDDDNA